MIVILTTHLLWGIDITIEVSDKLHNEEVNFSCPDL